MLQVIEETVKDESREVKKVGKAVEDITDEMEAVQKDVKRTSGKLDEVAEDVEEIKQEVKGRDHEHTQLNLK